MSTIHVVAVHPTMNREVCQATLTHFVQQFEGLVPDRLYTESRRGGTEIPITVEQLTTLMRTWDTSMLDEVSVWRHDETVDIRLQSFEAEHPLNWFEFEFNTDLVASGGLSLESLYAFAWTLAQASSPLSVSVHLSDDLLHLSRRDEGTPFHVFARNYWSPQLIRWIGFPAVQRADWLRVEELRDGWLCLDAYPSPFEFERPECLDRRKRITEALRVQQLNQVVDRAIWTQEPLTKAWPAALPSTALIGG